MTTDGMAPAELSRNRAAIREPAPPALPPRSCALSHGAGPTSQLECPRSWTPTSCQGPVPLTLLPEGRHHRAPDSTPAVRSAQRCISAAHLMTAGLFPGASTGAPGAPEAGSSRASAGAGWPAWGCARHGERQASARVRRSWQLTFVKTSLSLLLVSPLLQQLPAPERHAVTVC